MTVHDIDRRLDSGSFFLTPVAGTDSNNIVDNNENFELVFAWRLPSESSNTASVTLTGTVIDDDSADYTLSTLGSLTEGGSTTFTAVLDAQPASDVILTLTSSDTDIATVTAMLTFTNSDWSIAKTADVSGVNNNLIDGDRDYTITVAVDSGPGGYGTLANKELSGTATDDDAASAGVTLNPTSTLTSIAEDGSITFTAVLDAQPSSDVVLTLTSSDTDVATVTANLTFTNSDWSTTQTVNVAGVDNDLIDGDQDYTITVAVDSGPGSYGDGTVTNQELSGTVTDDDTAGVTLNPTSTLPSIAEGGSTTFTAVLDAQPSTDVVLALTSSDIDIATVTARLTFTPSNWSTPQTANVAGVNNDLIGDQDYTITVAVNSSPLSYSFVTNQELSGTVTDNDTAGVTLDTTSTSTSIAEDGSTTFTAVLDAQPSSNVVLTLTSSDTDIATVTAMLTFTTSDWSTPKTANVAGVNNDLIGDQDYTITVAIDDGASDDNFDDVVNQVLSGTVTDDDTAGVTLNPTSNLLSIAEDGSTTFTAVLDAQPSSEVVLTLTSSDPDVATVTAMLTFTPSDWSISQTANVAGVNNDLIGDQDYTITVAIDDGASDDDFDGVVNQVLSGSVTDNDAANANYTLGTLGSLTEGDSTTFTVVLDAQPASDVVLTLTSSATSIATVNPMTLTFTNGNWATVQMVSVAGVNNNLIDGDRDYTITVAVDSGPGGYGALANKELTGTVTDDDAAGITFSTGTTLPDLSRDETITFTAVLQAQPAASNVVLTLTSSDPDVATVDPTTLTFTSGDWDTTQTITVTAAENADEETTSYTITVAFDASSDGDFGGLDDILLTGEVSYGLTEAGEVQSKSAVAVADTFGAAQIATDLISARIQQPPAGLQARLAGNQLLGLDTPTNTSFNTSDDLWDWDHEDQANWSNDFASLISGTDFVLPLSSSADGTSQVELWAAVGHTDLNGDPTIDNVKVNYDGTATGVHVGIGRQQQDGLNYGLAVGSTKVELDLTGDDVTKIERDLLSFHPYIGWSLAEDTNAWLIAGIGDGDYDLDLANGTQENTEASMLMLGGGVQRAWTVNNYEFAARLEGTNTRSEIEKTDTLAGSKGSAWQLRAELEVGQSYRTETGGQVHPYATFGYRRDGGDIGSSGAGELGLGLRSQLNNAWSIDVKSRLQVTDADHERRSYQGYLKYDHGFDQRGFLFSVSHSYDYEIEQEEDTSSLTNEYEGRIGYGWGRTLFKQRGIVGIHLKSLHDNDSSGLVLGLGFEAPSLQFGLDGSNEEVKVHLNYINVEY